MLVHRCESSVKVRASVSRTTVYSSDVSASGLGTTPAASNSLPLCTRSVASPPSSRIMFGPLPSGHIRICSVHHQYSGKGLTLPCKYRNSRRDCQRCQLGRQRSRQPHDLVWRKYCKKPNGLRRLVRPTFRPTLRSAPSYGSTR